MNKQGRLKGLKNMYIAYDGWNVKVHFYSIGQLKSEINFALLEF